MVSEQARTLMRQSTAAWATGPRFAITYTFLIQGLLFASWTPHIPQIKRALGLGDAALGTALLGAPIGSVLAMLATGWLLPRLGSRLMVQITLVGYCLSVMTIGLAHTPFALFLSLALVGVFQGAMDVSMNTQGITVERWLRRPIMSGLHGAWSIGALTGAAAGALAVGQGISLTSQMVVLGLVVLLSAGWLSLRLLPDPATEPHATHAPRRGSVLTHPVVLVLSGVAFAAMICEGAVADWSAVYLRDALHTSATLAGFGYVAFSTTMVALRLGGNALLTRVSPRTALPVLSLIATVGLGGALLLDHPVAALIGFGALGVGLATVIPTAFSAAGQLRGINAGTAVAAVSSLGWAGFICGPPLIGHLAEWVSLPVALGLLPLLTVAVAVGTRATRVLDDVHADQAHESPAG